MCQILTRLSRRPEGLGVFFIAAGHEFVRIIPGIGYVVIGENPPFISAMP